MTSANLNLPTEYALMTRFDDIDLLREVGQSWDVDFVQIERGQFSGDISYVVTQNTHVAKVGLGRALNQHGAPPVGMRTLVVPSSNTSRFEWRGLKVTGQDILAFPPGGGLSCVSRSGFEVTIVSVAEDLLARVSERMGIPPLDRLLSGSEAISSSRKMMRRLRTALRALERNLQDHSFSLGEPKMRELLDDEIPRRLLDAVGATVEIRETTSRRTRELALKRVLDFIEANEEDSVSLRQLCTAAMVGERTLQYAFKERFGVGPKEYLTAFKLNRVRRQLRLADPRETKVNDVANRWGFWHMGQFAADFRRLFGELPSKTLGRPAKTAATMWSADVRPEEIATVLTPHGLFPPTRGSSSLSELPPPAR